MYGTSEPKKYDGLRAAELKKSRVVTFGASRYLFVFSNDVSNKCVRCQRVQLEAGYGNSCIPVVQEAALCKYLYNKSRGNVQSLFGSVEAVKNFIFSASFSSVKINSF